MLLVHKKNHKSNKKNLPPGEMGLPWIGETLAFHKAQQKNLLFEKFVQPRIQKHGKIFKTRLMGSPTIVVNGVEANHFFLSNEFKLVISSWPSSSVQLMGKDSIMEKQGEAHRVLRGVISTSLGRANLEALVPKMCNSILLHLDKNWGDKEDKISLYRTTKLLIFSIVFECLLGIGVEEGMLSTFEKVLDGIFAPPFKYLPGSRFWRAKGARKEIEKWLVEVVRKKREEMIRRILEGEEGATLLCRLVGGMIKGEISEKEVVDNVVLLVFAAHDTTSFAIAMTFKMMAKHPKSYATLLREHVEIMKNKKVGEKYLTLEDTKKMKETWKVARESMRLFPPIFGSFRKAITDIHYQGLTIPKGWKVLWTAYGTHYNKEYFHNPMEFDPSRFEEPIQRYAFVPFGGGPRLCAGYQLAKLNILLFVHYVVTRYHWSLIHPQEPITMDPLPVPSHGMPIKIYPKF
ncbi:hypothetical protein LguiB_011564 [Lonicera macranthoides]